MKDFINILLILALVFFAIGITYVQVNNPTHVWAFLYVPLFVLMILLGVKLNYDY
jgi:hypothetical protein